MTEWARALIEDFGYGGIALLMLVENVFPPIPSEAVLPLAGYTTTRGELALPLVVVAATVGSVVGALAFYWAGLALGEERLQSVVARHGGWITLTTDDLERGRRWFERHGGKAVLACRLVPGLRSVISIPAGVVRMRLWRFLALTAVGTAVWCTALAWAGRALGREHGRVASVLDPMLYTVLAGALLLYVVRVVRWRRQQRA